MVDKRLNKIMITITGPKTTAVGLEVKILRTTPANCWSIATRAAPIMEGNNQLW